MHMKSDIILI